MKKNIPKFFIALWLVLLLLLGVYYVGFAPRGSEYTEAENRTLASFPEVNAQTIFSGQYSQEIETYLLDRFPFRNEAIAAVNKAQGFISFASHDEYLRIAENVEDVLVSDDYAADLDALLNEIDSDTQPPATQPPITDAPETAATEPSEIPPIVSALQDP